MSLRTRLVLAFFLLSVVPLAAVTTYTYVTNVEALRVAAQREADLLAGELGQRMQLVTAQLSERVEHLMDIAELQAAADAAAADSTKAAAAPAPAAVTTSPTSAGANTSMVIITSQNALSDQIAKSLGQTAMLLNNVQMRNMRGGGGGPGGDRGGGRGGRGGPPPAVPPAPSMATVGRAIPTSPVTAATPTPAPTPSGAAGAGANANANQPSRGRTPRPNPGDPGQTGGRTFDPTRDPQRFGGGGQRPGGPPPSGPPPMPGTPPAPGSTAQTTTITPITDANGNLMIDMGPLRRDLMRQVLPADKRIEDLTAEERQRLAAEVNQRLLGIQQGIQISAAELQKRAVEAEKVATEKAEAAAKAAPKAAPASKANAKAQVAPAELKRKSSLTGNNIAVTVERNGEVVRSMNAEMNLRNVLGLVFSTTQSDRGELPFAVAKDGTIYTRTDSDKERVAAFGAVAKPDGPSMARLPDWIVVTTDDKSGSGLRLGVARPVGDSLMALRRASARNAGLGLGFIAIALIGIVPLSSRLTRNLTALNEGVSRIAHGDYRARVPVKSKDEVGQLAVAFNQMATDVERHQHQAVEQERIRRELELGRQIQNEMLPHAPLNLGLTQVQGVSVPAREVGGDFFNYFVLDDGKVALLMGDVSGKGVGAALLMANIQASLRIRLGLGQSLAAVADALDRDIEANSPGPVYATLFIGVLDPASRLLRYVNAGHNPQYALRLQGGLERMHATGLPVGLLAGRGYTERSVQLAPGDLLFFYTDGCVEAENEKGEPFGTEQLEPLLLASVKSANPLHSIEDAIKAFRGKSEPLDDATLMTVKVG